MVTECEQCKSVLIRGPRDNNKKFCNSRCRNKHYWATRLHQKATDKQNVEASIERPDKVKCAICDKWYRQVGSHVWNTHKVLARDYREAYGFDLKRGQLRGEYKRLKSKQVFECGGVKNLVKGKVYRFKQGQEGVGKYHRSEETMQRLRKLHLFNQKKKRILKFWGDRGIRLFEGIKDYKFWKIQIWK